MENLLGTLKLEILTKNATFSAQMSIFSPLGGESGICMVFDENLDLKMLNGEKKSDI